MRTAVFIPLRLQRNAAKRITPVLAIHPAPFTQFTHGLFIGKLMTIGVLKQLLNIQMKFNINRFFTLCWDFSFFSWAYGMVWLSSKCCGSKSIVFVFPYFLLFTTEPFGKYCGADFPNLPYFLNPFKGQEELDAKKRNKLSWESEPEGFSGAIQRGPHCLKKSEVFCY